VRFGAVFTYHVGEEPKSREKRRQDREKPLVEAGKDTPYPGWAEAEAERREPKPAMVLTVRDAAGSVVRRIDAPTGRGFHRVAWDLRLPAPDAIGARSRFSEEGDEGPKGPLAAPGAYSVALATQVDGVTTEVAGPVRFEVTRLRTGALPGSDPAEAAAFAQRVAGVQRTSSAASQAATKAFDRLKDVATAIDRTRSAPGGLDAERHAIEQELYAIQEQLDGNRARGAIEDDGPITIARRVQVAAIGSSWSTYGPTPTHRRSLELAEADLAKLRERLNTVLVQQLPALEKKLEAAGAPWTAGQPVPPLP